MENKEVEFTLRSPKIEDKVAFAKHGNNIKIWNNMGDRFPHPYTEELAELRIQHVLKTTGPQNWFIIDVNGEAVGKISIALNNDIHKKNGELGYWLAEEFWGKGIVSRAIEKILKYAFETFDIVRIYAHVISGNLGSQKVLEKNGFKLEAVLKKAIYKNDVLKDDLIYSILKEDYENKGEKSVYKDV